MFPPSVVAQVQRDRLLEAMVMVVAEHGYERASVAKVLSHAGVSRRTFYALFRGREECFLAAYDEVVAHVSVLVVDAYLHDSSAGHPIHKALAAFLGFCADEPKAARFCIVEVLAAGPRARARRAAMMERLAGLMEEALPDRNGDRDLGSLAAQAFIGGVHELVYGPVDRGEVADLPALGKQIVASQVALLALA